VVPAYSRWLESSPEVDTGKPQVLPLNIPVGKLETPGRKSEVVKAPEIRKPPTAPTSPVPVVQPVPGAAMAASGMVLASFDVELVPVPLPATPRPADQDERRGVFALSRRDAIMLIAGAVLAILAIMAGWGLSRILGRTPPPESPPTAPNVTNPSEG
jgi:hypothetical protein